MARSLIFSIPMPIFRISIHGSPASRRLAALRAALAPVCLGLSLGLAACGDSTQPAAADEARAESLHPAEAALAEKYERSCAVCHTKIASNAPLTGFAAAWKPRLAKGVDALVLSAQQGFNGMPAGGQCADCTAAELRALIEFMSQGK